MPPSNRISYGPADREEQRRRTSLGDRPNYNYTYTPRATYPYPPMGGTVSYGTNRGYPSMGSLPQSAYNRGAQKPTSPLVMQPFTKPTGPAYTAPALAVKNAGGNKNKNKNKNKGTKVDTEAGKNLPALPPELQRWYLEQLSNVRTEEQKALLEQQLAKRAAMREAAMAGRQARAYATGLATDVGAAMAESGLGSSPALIGSALDQVYGSGRAAALDAEAARMAALENYLRAEQGILGTGRRRKSDLEDWRALQIAALSNDNLAKLLGMSPGGTN